MRTFGLAALMVVISMGLASKAFADDKADVRKAVKDAVTDDINDLIKGKKLKLQPKQVGAIADNIVAFYSDEVIDAFIRSGDPAKIQLKNPKQGWFRTRAGFIAVGGNAGYKGLNGRVESLVFTDEKAAVVFKFQPVNVVAIYIPWDKGAPDLDNVKVLRPEFNKADKTWVIQSPGAGNLQLLK